MGASTLVGFDDFECLSFVVAEGELAGTAIVGRTTSETEFLCASGFPDGFDAGTVKAFKLSKAGEGIFVDPPVVVLRGHVVVVEWFWVFEMHVCGDDRDEESSAQKEGFEREHRGCVCFVKKKEGLMECECKLIEKNRNRLGFVFCFSKRRRYKDREFN